MELIVLLNVTAVCNAGLLVEYDGQSILIDGIACNYLGFQGLCEDHFDDILYDRGLFSGLCGVLFTHCHPDHFDAAKVLMLREERPELVFFTPDGNTAVSGCIQCGSFSVLYSETPHMPHSFEQVRHFVFLIRAGEESIYIAADAMLDAAMHQSILRDVRPSLIAVNPVYLTQSSTLELLRSLCPERIFIYHIPVDPQDLTGMRRKAERSVARCSDSMPPLVLINKFPMQAI